MIWFAEVTCLSDKQSEMPSSSDTLNRNNNGKFPEQLSKGICGKDNQAGDQEEDVKLPKQEHEAGKIANASIPFIEGLSQEVRRIAQASGVESTFCATN